MTMMCALLHGLKSKLADSYEIPKQYEDICRRKWFRSRGRIRVVWVKRWCMMVKGRCLIRSRPQLPRTLSPVPILLSWTSTWVSSWNPQVVSYDTLTPVHEQFLDSVLWFVHCWMIQSSELTTSPVHSFLVRVYATYCKCDNWQAILIQ